jgi:hypothetical protein
VRQEAFAQRAEFSQHLSGQVAFISQHVFLFDYPGFAVYIQIDRQMPMRSKKTPTFGFSLILDMSPMLLSPGYSRLMLLRTLIKTYRRN